MTDDALRKQLKALPKIELHRHLEGSLRLETLAEIAQEYTIGLPHDVERLRPYVQIVEDDPADLHHFLKKFHSLRLFYRSPEIIDRVTYEAIQDCAADNVKYLELRFTPRALAATMGFPLEDVADWVLAASERATRDFDIDVRLIVSMNRHEAVELGEEMARLAVDRMSRGVVGLDLAGNEADFSATPFAPLFVEAGDAGLKLTVHASEWAGPESAREAIEHLGARRLGHGVRVIQDESVAHVARERGVALEVCVTSNVQSGSVESLARHPLAALYRRSLLTTINTDDPGVSDITLSSEMAVAVEQLDLTLDDVKQHVLNAAQVAFLPDDERDALVRRFQALLTDDSP